MQAIEQKMIAYFAHLPILNNDTPNQSKLLDAHFWYHFRRQAILKQPDLAHDVVQVRLVSYQLGFISLGLADEIARKQAQLALDYFIELRSDFTVPEKSKTLLANLSKKLPLVALSNGNVDTKVLGISQYFQHIYHAGWQVDGSLLKQKPASDMFALACKKLAIKPSELLHVGDCGRADIQGALLAGCQAAWLSCYDVGKPVTELPHIDLKELSLLELLLSR